MLVAASPVEIEARSEAAGLPPEAQRAAQRLFHALTDRIGQAAIARERQHEDWPNHRFYFGTAGQQMDALLEGLRSRGDLMDIAAGQEGEAEGLYARAEEAGYVAVLVAHRNLEGLRSTHTG